MSDHPNQRRQLRPLSGKTACITGGARGIGAAVADRLHDLGAELMLAGRTERTLSEKCEQLAGARYQVTDVANPADVERLFAQMRTSPDILVNNAGCVTSAPLHRTTNDNWNTTLGVNLSGVFYCCRAAVGPMIERGYGRVINIASTSALKGYRYVAAYCAAKHGVVGLTRALAQELASYDITVNAICPGFTETDLLAESVENIVAATGRSEEQARASLRSTNPQGRFIQPAEVAGTVAWLLSNEARSVTGQSIVLAGGEI